MFILDTDVLTILHQGRGDLFENLMRRMEANRESPICVTVVSIEEQARGWLAWIAGAKSMSRLIEGYARFNYWLTTISVRPILPFTEITATEFQRLVRLKLRVGTMDLRIAAIALANNAVVVTRNTIDFGRISSLRVEDWTLAP